MQRWANLIWGLVFVFGGTWIVVTGRFERLTYETTGMVARVGGAGFIVIGIILIAAWLRKIRSD